MGKLNHIAFGAPLLKFLLGNIYSSLAAALQLKTSHLIRTSRSFRDALHAICTMPHSVPSNTMHSFHTSNVA
jgi:hypothetical protein